jgi:hypothetical protein
MLHFQRRVSMIILGLVKTGRLYGYLIAGPSGTFNPLGSIRPDGNPRGVRQGEIPLSGSASAALVFSGGVV